MPGSHLHSTLARPVLKVLALVGLLALAIVPATALAASARGRHTKGGHHSAPTQCKGKKGKSESRHCNGGGSNSGLVTLTDHATGFTVRAPRDFSLTRTSKGVEKVFSKSRGAFVNYLLVATAEAPAKVAATLIAQSKSTVTSSTQTPTSYTANVVHAGHRERFQVRQVSSGKLALIAWGVHKVVSKRTGKSKGKPSHGKGPKQGGHRALKASTANAAAASSLEPLLEQIAGTARGGKAISTPIEKKANPVAPVALQPFTNSDHSATAQVPVGFNCGGAKGIIECLDTAHGGIEFGVGMPVCVPGSTKAYYAEHVPGETALCPAIAGYQESTAAATTLWGPALDRLVNAGIAGVTLVTSKPVSFAGWNASFDLLRFTRNGVPWEAAMIAATTTATGSAEEWLFYYSDVSAPQSGDSAYGQALAQSWASFNPSAAESQRLTESENAQKETTQIIDEADAFRQEVSEEADENWDAYIRGTYELPGERVTGELEEKTREAIGKAKEEIEEQLP
ncbi:MAG TPA: hypothetical protein VEJ23_05505 [Solirubrobacteraceae bacterium]|nr:hypothetical protein [Solirubrobacteraceae bacterium]